MVREVLLVLACSACFATMLLGGLCCLVGSEAITTGLNPLPWLKTFGLLVALPCIGCVLSLWELLRHKRS